MFRIVVVDRNILENFDVYDFCKDFIDFLFAVIPFFFEILRQDRLLGPDRAFDCDIVDLQRGYRQKQKKNSEKEKKFIHILRITPSFISITLPISAAKS